MVDYESGSPAWDNGAVLLRHASDDRAGPVCAKVAYLRQTTPAHGRFDPHDRMRAVHETECTCGAGDSPSEHTTERRTPECLAPNSSLPSSSV